LRYNAALECMPYADGTSLNGLKYVENAL